MESSVAERAGRSRHLAAALIGYVGTQLAVTLASAMTTGSIARLLHLTVAVTAVAALTFGVVRRRPAPTLGWRFILASIWTIIASGVIDGLTKRVGEDSAGSLVPTVLAALALPMLAVGLALLSRSLAPRDPADVLDAVMTALAAFLLIWVFVIAAVLDSDISTLSAAIAFPIGFLLVFTTSVKLVLSGGLHDPPIALVLAAVGALLMMFGVILVSALYTGTLRGGRLVDVFGSLYFVALGAAGLHPWLGGPRQRSRASSDTTGKRAPCSWCWHWCLPWPGLRTHG